VRIIPRVVVCIERGRELRPVIPREVTVNNATLSENVLGSLQVELNEGPILVENSYLCSSGIGVNVLNSTYLTLNNNTLVFQLAAC